MALWHCRARQAVVPLTFGRDGSFFFPPGREGMPMYITLADLFQYSLVLIGMIGLFAAIKKK